MRADRKSMIVAASVIAAAGNSALLTWLFFFWEPMPCENTLLSEFHSPDGRSKLVVFERSCGATTDFSTQASLIGVAQALDDEAGNAFIADTDHGRAPRADHGGPALDVLWLDASTVQLTHDVRTRVFHALAERDGVKITYVKSRARSR